MGKMKVHELAKELNMQSKELVDKLVELKYDVKSHLSVLEDEDVAKIKKQLKVKSSSENVDKAQPKKDKKPIAPVIIRREVTRVAEAPEEKPVARNPRGENDFGVVQRRTDTSMNIMYRTPPRKIGTITLAENSKSLSIISLVK